MDHKSAEPFALVRSRLNRRSSHSVKRWRVLGRDGTKTISGKTKAKTKTSGLKIKTKTIGLKTKAKTMIAMLNTNCKQFNYIGLYQDSKEQAKTNTLRMLSRDITSLVFGLMQSVLIYPVNTGLETFKSFVWLRFLPVSQRQESAL